MEDRLSQPFLLPVSLPTAPAPFILRRSQLLLPLRLLAPTSCHSWQRHWAIGLFPVSSLRQILGQRAMWITRPFAFAHACPYLLPSLAKALGYSVSSPSHPWDRYWDKERCGSAPFAFAHACPYLLPLIPGKGTGLFRLFPVSSLRQILGQKGMRITAPFAFAHSCPYLLPSLAKALGYSVSSPSHPWDRYWDKERCELLGGWVPQRYFQARLLTRHKFSGQFPVPKIAPVRLVAPAPPRPYLRQQMRHGWWSKNNNINDKNNGKQHIKARHTFRIKYASIVANRLSEFQCTIRSFTFRRTFCVLNPFVYTYFNS